MKTSNNRKTHAFKGAAALITAALLALLFTACPNAAGGGTGGNTGGGSSDGGSTITPDAAVLTLDPANKTIEITVKTSDGSAVTVEGADKTSVNSGEKTVLTAAGDTITLKSDKIVHLNCGGNKLTALDVRGLSSLQELACLGNQLTALNVDNVTELKYLNCAINKLDAAALTAVLNGLPARAESDHAECTLFSEFPELNCKNYKFEAPIPKALEAAFKKARDEKHWTLQKYNSAALTKEIVLPGDPGTASLTVDPAKKTIKVTVTTSDGSTIYVEGANKTSITSGVETTLTATGNTITLKSGKITKLDCRDNKLTALDVRGLYHLQKLDCYGNQLTALKVDNLTKLKTLFCHKNKLDAAALTAVLNGLPARAESDHAECALFSERPVDNDENYQFDEEPVPEALEAAFKKARDEKHWRPLKLYYTNIFSDFVLPGEAEYGTAVLTVDPANKKIKVTVTTSDGSKVDVLGADKTSIKSGKETELTAAGKRIILKNAQITELICRDNKLTALDVRGLYHLQKLDCYGNQLTALDSVKKTPKLKTLYCHKNKLNAAALTAVLNGLPERQASDSAICILFSEDPGDNEQNYQFDGTIPADLRAAFESARDERNWSLQKYTGSNMSEEFELP
ncbi:hypothetical protein H0R92_11435 [Treponema sp. OMZ 840]|uniref:leucine-rich repeat domain-containing protein n=1 Tax=Treponema sp. OMZ 840 TaxID=244313 RepID=UPI003D903545